MAPKEKVGLKELWDELKQISAKLQRVATLLGSPEYVQHLALPTEPFDTCPPKLREVEEVIKKAWSASAPGTNGLPYKLYKSCPQVVKILW